MEAPGLFELVDFFESDMAEGSVVIFDGGLRWFGKTDALIQLEIKVIYELYNIAHMTDINWVILPSVYRNDVFISHFAAISRADKLR